MEVIEEFLMRVNLQSSGDPVSEYETAIGRVDDNITVGHGYDVAVDYLEA